MTAFSDQAITDILAKVQAQGIDQCSVDILDNQFSELNVEHGDINLLRTSVGARIFIQGIKNHKRADVTINSLDQLDNAIAELATKIDASPEDRAWDLAEKVSNPNVSVGDLEPNLDSMYAQLAELNDLIAQEFPTVLLESLILKHNNLTRQQKNSLGLNLTEQQGWYVLSIMGTAKDEFGTSSFNYSDVESHTLEGPLIEWGNIREMLQDLKQQTQSKTLPEEFQGQVIFAPDTVPELIEFVVDNTSDNAMIDGTSIYTDKLDQQIFSDKLSVRFEAEGSQRPGEASFTKDGRVCENSVFIENGYLRHFNLERYGANRTGQKAGPHDHEGMVIVEGHQHLQTMIAGVKKGLLVNRLSGGYPAKNGDFSSVAKNSFYIEDGKIAFPVQEVMIGGNMHEVLNNIDDISLEQQEFGSHKAPWILCSGLAIS